MAESYSTSLKITLIGDGDLAGTWGDTTNTNWNLVEQAVTGVDYLTTMGDSNYTLTNLNGISDEARNQVIVVPSSVTLSAARYVYAPYVNKTYIISNQSSGGQSIYIQGIVSGTPTGSPLLIPNGVTTVVYCDGVNGFYAGATGSAGNFLVNGNFSVTGNEVDVGNITVGGNLAVTGTSTFTGIPYGPTASTGVNNTQLATTQYVTTAVTNATGSLGTMSTQNANNVAISGGNINNVAGTNPSLNVGYATNAGNSTNTSQTNFSNLTIGGNQVLDAANYTSYSPTLSGGGAYGTWGINITGNAGSVSNGVYNNGGTYSINITGSAGSAGYATTAGNANAVFGKTKLGLGITGETWNYPGRSFNTTYYNPYSYPIAVSASATCDSTSVIHAYVNGNLVSFFQWQFNGCGSYGGAFIIVPPGASYSLNSSQGVYNWTELY
jgi:hypothetical protein